MKAEDLRIGNLLRIYSKFSKVVSIGNYGISFHDYEGSSGFIKYTHPLIQHIPLSEDVLLKCGFEKYTHAFVINISDKGDTLTYNFTQQIWWIGNKPMYNIDIKHLHQLQNLYYALTGEELEVSL